MKVTKTRGGSVLIAAALFAASMATASSSGALAAPAPAPSTKPTYVVSSGAVVQVGHATDTPASPFIDTDGSFHFQQSAALYGATEPREWEFYSGTTFDDATRSATSDSVNPANSKDSNADTTWRCNNSPTGLKSTYAPAGSGYSQRNYCDLTSTWVDPDTGDWYGLVHNEFTPQPMGDGLHFDAIDYAVSHDKGKTWAIRDQAITSPYSTTRGDKAAFPNQTYYYGDGDQRLIVDAASGFFYVFYGSRVINQSGGWAAPGFAEHVARAPIADKMAKGSWQKYFDGKWQSPGIGGSETNITSVSSTYPNGAVPASQSYNPKNTGTISQQAAAGQLPANGSDLFVMNVSYSAYLGKYIGTPQTDTGDGVSKALHFYATDDLATQQWTDIGSAAAYTQQSWYRWMVDSATATTGTILGKTFRSYCYFACSTTQGSESSSEYVNITIGSSSPAAPILDSQKAYSIGSGSGQHLTQSGVNGVSAVGGSTGTGQDSWKFAANGDGSYAITNAGSGLALGVDSTSTANRAWGTKPTLSAPAASTVGQQWFLQADVAAQSSGASTATGSYHLTNRYSGLVLSLGGAGVQTSPYRNWTNSTAGTATTDAPDDQTMSFTAAPAVSILPALSSVTSWMF